ncbi:tyrosine aminotransferase [Lates japonicus]|uniref:Tyrosine aminotransferase n=1 Tax=Lates japonicus TaxID=270547 RepID=A0AAD3N4L2_LATJO|nr:tyrosine aminotransferase [Lates japonicus]
MGGEAFRDVQQPLNPIRAIVGGMTHPKSDKPMIALSIGCDFDQWHQSDDLAISVLCGRATSGPRNYSLYKTLAVSMEYEVKLYNLLMSGFRSSENLGGKACGGVGRLKLWWFRLQFLFMASLLDVISNPCLWWQLSAGWSLPVREEMMVGACGGDQGFASATAPARGRDSNDLDQ